MSARRHGSRRMSGSQAIVACAVAVSALLALLVSVPLMGAALRHADETRDELALVEHHRAAAGRLRSDPGAAAQLRRLRVAVPGDPGLETLQADLQQLAESSGMRWVASRQQPVRRTRLLIGGEPRDVATYAVSVTVDGSPDQAARLLAGLTELRRLVVVDAVTSDPSGVTVSMRTFATKQEGEGR